MKIAILVHNLTGGGAERVAALWSSGFVSYGHEVLVVTQNDLSSNTYEISPKVKVFPIVSPVWMRYLCKMIRNKSLINKLYVKKLKKILEEYNVDVCIGVMGSYLFDLISFASEMGIDLIQTYHGAFELPSSASKQRRADLIKEINLGKLILYNTVLSKADKKVIGNKMHNVVVLPNPLTFMPFEGNLKKQKIILACGRLDVWEVKGFDLLLEAWGKIAHCYPSWKLQIAGTGDKKSKRILLKIVEKYNIQGQVEFTGFVNDVVNLYRNAEIFVLSSRYEGFGMVLIEAMSQGCACVAADFKGRQKEIIEHDGQGIICEANDVLALTNSIQKFIEDEDYRKKCQENAIERSKDFSIENIMLRWEALFEQYHIGTKKNNH